MVTIEDIEIMDFGLKKDRKYNIFKKSNKKKDRTIISEGIYMGESGVHNDYLIFKSTKNNIVECFLKIDIVNGEYTIRELGKY